MGLNLISIKFVLLRDGVKYFLLLLLSCFFLSGGYLFASDNIESGRLSKVEQELQDIKGKLERSSIEFKEEKDKLQQDIIKTLVGVTVIIDNTFNKLSKDKDDYTGMIMIDGGNISISAKFDSNTQYYSKLLEFKGE